MLPPFDRLGRAHYTHAHYSVQISANLLGVMSKLNEVIRDLDTLLNR